MMAKQEMSEEDARIFRKWLRTTQMKNEALVVEYSSGPLREQLFAEFCERWGVDPEEARSGTPRVSVEKAKRKHEEGEE